MPIFIWRLLSFTADVTILLALSVFQTIVNGNLPPTSDAVPLLGMHLCITLSYYDTFHM